MSYSVLSLISVTIFALVHLWAQKTNALNRISRGKFLSAGGGVAIAYVFIDILPKLSKSDYTVTQALAGVFPYFERHVYIMALLGFLLFFTVDRVQKSSLKKRSFWLSFASYSLFNFLVGYAVVDKENPEVRPLILFTIAIALHYFTNDFALTQEHKKEYQRMGKWLLIGSLFLGWIVGFTYTLSPTAIALVSAFIGGGVIMNVTRHELPSDNPNSLNAFLFCAAMYTIILLFIGK
jgi:hypothetical protein